MEKRRFYKKDTVLAVIMAVLFVLLLVAVIFPGSRQTERKSKTVYDLFDTEITVYDYTGKSDRSFDKTFNKLESLFRYYDSLFDIYDSHGDTVNLYDLNAAAGGEPVKVDRELIDFLKYSKDIYEKTDGEVNIAMGAVLSLWHDQREAGNLNPDSAALPDSEALREASLHCNIDDIIIDEENSTVRLLDSKMSLDVGAVGKGYAAERAAEMLYEANLSGWALDVGGNLRVIGTKTNGEPWETGIKNPNTLSENRYVYTFSLADGSAATSGDYERYYVVNGKKYHHIIDKDTLFPPAEFSSVTVIVSDAGLADSLSTALFCMTLEEGRALINRTDGAFAVWVLPSGEVLTSESN